MHPKLPLRVAAIDVGSNAMRFSAVEVAAGLHLTPLDYVRSPVRLGHDAFSTGVLSAQIMDAGIAALAQFRRRMDSLGIDHYRAVATSAVRDSENGGHFIQRAWDECLIRLEPIAGTEEARLVWMAVRDRVPLGDQRWLLVDLGGGSVELSLVDAERVHWCESEPLGTVRLLEEVRSSGGGSPEEMRRIVAEHAGHLRISGAAERSDAAGVIATGGNIETLAELAAVQADPRGVRRLPVAALRRVLGELAQLPAPQRMQWFGLRQDRADVIVPAAMIYERIAQLVGAGEIVVPGVGVKDGVLLDVIDDLVNRRMQEMEQEQEIMAGTLALGRRCGFDEAHARQVARLSLSLFDQLQDQHQLGEQERRILLAAALLHDIGQFVSNRRHHRHSHYLISHSELPGFSPKQIRLIAVVARYHRRAEPQQSHREFAAMSGNDQERVRLLASLLRIADALDREHAQRVQTVSVKVRKHEVELLIQGSGELAREQQSLRKKSRLFEDVYDLKVRVDVEPAPAQVE